MRVNLKAYIRNIPLLRNLKYLMTQSLADREKDLMWNMIKKTEDLFLYEFDEDFKRRHPIPSVLNTKNTIKLLMEKPKSYCRFGDGEAMLMMGNSIPYQQWSAELSKKLLEALTIPIDNLYVGINYSYFHSTDNTNEFVRRFHLLGANVYREFFLQHINANQTYINAGFNQEYMSLQYNNEYFCKLYTYIRKMFYKKKIVVVAGEGVIDGLRYNLYNDASEFYLITGPTTNAFQKYNLLLDEIHKFDLDYTICLQIGPTSKVLAYELSKDGYMAWDVGHLAQDYDAFRKNIPRNNKTMQSFWSPDNKE